MTEKIFYEFGEASLEDYKLVGMKGAYLSEMTKLGLPVPQGFTISSVASSIVESKGVVPIRSDLKSYITRLEKKTGREFGNPKNPLIVSVRSGAPVSMPGIMDTILNIGITPATLKTDDSPFMANCYKRLLLGFIKNIYLKSSDSSYYKFVAKAQSTQEILDAKLSLDSKGLIVPDEVESQLEVAIRAVFASWNSPRAGAYRKAEGIDNSLKTAVNIQRMVFGNRDEKSLTAVFFSRNPQNGQKELFGSYIPFAQGDELVGGDKGRPLSELEPELLEKFNRYAATLEKRYESVQEIEATVESGEEFILQTRVGKIMPGAQARILLDLLNEGRISKKKFFSSITAETLTAMSGKRIDPSAKYTVIAKGTPVVPGIAHSQWTCTTSELQDNGKGLLVKVRLEPEDVPYIKICDGIATVEGDDNLVSHPIVIARANNKPCITGINMKKEDYWRVNGELISCKTPITINGNTGEIINGHVNLIDTVESPERSEIEAIVEAHNQIIPEMVRFERNLERAKKLSQKERVFYFSRVYDQIDNFYLALMGDKKELKKLTSLVSREFKTLNSANHPVVLGIPSYDFFYSIVSQRDEIEIFRNDMRIKMKDLAAGLKDAKSTKKLEAGDPIVYLGRNCSILKLCPGCGAKIVLPSGSTKCLSQDELPKTADINLASIVSLNVGKVPPIKISRVLGVYKAQREAARTSAKKNKIIIADYDPRMETIESEKGKLMMVRETTDPLIFKLRFLAENAQ
jgi:pyruvate,phosphate dikinase